MLNIAPIFRFAPFRKEIKIFSGVFLFLQIVNEERVKQAQPLRLKKLYVLGALLVEQYHEQNKAQIAKETQNESSVGLNTIFD